MVLCLQLREATLVSGAQHGRASHGGEGEQFGGSPRRRTLTESADALGGERRHFFIMAVGTFLVGHLPEVVA